MKTIKELIEVFESGQTEFEYGGKKYGMYLPSPSIEDQNKWAHFEAEKFRLQAEINAKTFKDNDIIQHKTKAKFDAMKFAPHQKQLRGNLSLAVIPLTAKEICDEAEIIYKWLINGIE